MIVFISPTAVEGKAATDWAAAEAEKIIRQCPVCNNDSVIGHGRRSKQAHDERHDWIGIRRGYCNHCLKTITFLPEYSPPYGHYSLLARSQSLRLYFVEGCSLETATPSLKDPDRVPAGSTIRLWFKSLDSVERSDLLQQLRQAEATSTLVHSSGLRNRPRTSFPFLQKIMSAISDRLARPEPFRYGTSVVTWSTVAHFLKNLMPLRC